MYLFRSALIGAAILVAGSLSLAQAAPAPALETWQEAIGRTPAPSGGCFTADYPSTTWKRIACTVAPLRPYMPRTGGVSLTVGDGNDYAAVSAGLTSAATGSFPAVTGVTRESNNGSRNEYSLQLNSNFAKDSAACQKALTPSNCFSWQQFVYGQEGGAEAQGVLFMQYWLINFDKICPFGWTRFSQDCFRNSDSAVAVPVQALGRLGGLQLSGQARNGGLDTVSLATKTKAYSVTGQDSVVGLAGVWNASEFNVIGNGNGSAAKFNEGTSMTVRIALTDGTTAPPTCQAKSGTTAETNNLKLGRCKAVGGKVPFIRFTQSR